MPRLHELQARFGTALVDAEADALGGHIRADGLTPQRRLGIYRNNVFTNLREALRTLFPVLEQLVGKEFFDFTADEYIRHHPSPAGDLNEFGEQLPQFLAGFAPAAELVYLPDTARLEWLAHRVYHAAETTPLAFERLAEVAPERYGDLHFTLHPAAALLESPYPVHRIWQANQPDYEGETAVSLDAGPVRLLIERRDGRVEVQPLTLGEWGLLHALAHQEDFASACEAALASEPAFDLGATLRKLVAQSTLADFSLRDPSTT
jgi:hypothetical protein